MINKIIISFFFLICSLNYAQDVTLTTIDANCSADGEIQIQIENLDFQSANLDIRIYKHPDLTNPVQQHLGESTTTGEYGNTFTGFSGANYTVRINVVYPSGGYSEELNKTTSIDSTYEPMVVTPNLVPNCTGTNVVVNVTGGSAPYTFELLDSNGNLVLSNNSDPEFEFPADAPYGTYRVSVVDNCGVNVVQGFQVSAPSFTPSIRMNITDREFIGCAVDGIFQPVYLMVNNAPPPSYLYPLIVRHTVNYGDGTSEVFNDTITNTYTAYSPITFDHHYGEPYSILTEVSSGGCPGLSFSQNFEFNGLPNLSLAQRNFSCGEMWIEYRNIRSLKSGNLTVELISAPSGFDYAFYGYSTSAPHIRSVQYNGTSTQSYPIVGVALSGMPLGTYNFRITDECGKSLTKSITVTAPDQTVLRANTSPGCDAGDGQIELFLNRSSVEMSSVAITQAPQEFYDLYNGGVVVASFDVSSYIGSPTYNRHRCRLINLPIGQYSFAVNTNCGENLSISRTIIGPELSYEMDYELNCGSFSLDFSVTHNLQQNEVYLQKYFPDSGRWGHPITGVLEPYENSPSFGNGIQLANINGNFNGNIVNQQVVDLGINTSGLFRIMSRNTEYDLYDGSGGDCYTVLEEFEIPESGIQFKNYYVTSCSGGQISLYIDALAFEPTFEIIEKEGNPVSIFSENNGNDPVFANLDPGTYILKISTTCGSQFYTTITIGEIKFPIIRPFNLCDGENGSLFLTGLSMFDIKWTKGNDPTEIGTGNRLYFSPYNSATDLGIYHAHITPTPGSCDPLIVSFDLTTNNENNPNAGTGGVYTVYQANLTGTYINLFDYLDLGGDTTYEKYGTWTETTTDSSGLLFENLWYAEFANNGTYTFKYSVSGTCSNTDTATITINFITGCTKPGLTGTPKEFTKFGISILEDNSLNSWPKGIPNGFITLESHQKGFVISRVANEAVIAEPKKGMLIYDIASSCVKLYNGSYWKCIERSCND